MNAKRYTASDVGDIVGINRNTLFYCVKTLGLIKPAQVKPRVTLYDFNNLLDLMLIQNLLSLGVSQEGIKMVLTGQLANQIHPHNLTVWEQFKQEREYREKAGFLLRIQILNNGASLWLMVERADLWVTFASKANDYAREKGKRYFYPGNGTIIVDIRDIVHYVENKTGETLE